GHRRRGGPHRCPRSRLRGDRADRLPRESPPHRHRPPGLSRRDPRTQGVALPAEAATCRLPARRTTPPARCSGRRDLPGTTARPLAGDVLPLLEDLAAPPPPRLPALERPLEAGRSQRTVGAERLGVLEAGGGLGEPDLGVID